MKKEYLVELTLEQIFYLVQAVLLKMKEKVGLDFFQAKGIFLSLNHLMFFLKNNFPDFFRAVKFDRQLNSSQVNFVRERMLINNFLKKSYMGDKAFYFFIDPCCFFCFEKVFKQIKLSDFEISREKISEMAESILNAGRI